MEASKMRPRVGMTFLAVAGMVMVGALARAQKIQAEKAPAQKSPWLHVQVTEAAKGGAKVDLNLPLSLAQIALEVAEDEMISGGQIKIHRSDVEVADLKRMWAELRAAGDAELVRSEEKDQIVSVSQRGGKVLVEVRDRSGAQKVHIEVSGSVVDALFSGEGNRLNLRAALSQLSASDRGEFIKIDDGESHVRVWID